MYKNISVKDIGKVRLIELNRPKSLNALSKDLLKELATVLKDSDTNKNIRCVVLTGNQKSFSSGADMKEAPESEMPFWAEKNRLLSWKTIENFKKPIIAAVNGFALGGGCELAMACDFIIASEDAKFGQPEINVGAIPGAGGSQRMPRFIGKSKAMYAILTGDMIDAFEAEKCGLVAKVFKNEEFLDNVSKIALKIAGKSAALARLAKETVNLSYETPLQEGLRAERAVFMSTFSLEDHVEGMTAFAQKRKPNWKNK